MKPLNEAQAWREIARWWAERKSGKSCAGLCHSTRVAMTLLDFEGWRDNPVYRRMRKRLAKYLPAVRQYDPYAWPEGRSRDERCLFALFMALVAEDDTQTRLSA